MFNINVIDGLLTYPPQWSRFRACFKRKARFIIRQGGGKKGVSGLS